MSFFHLETYPPAAIQKITRIDVLAAVLVSLVLTAALFWFHPLQSSNPVDPYVKMARNPFSYQVPPYGLRILTPLTVYFLPWTPDTGFRVVAVFSFVVSGILLAIWLRLVEVPLLAVLLLLPGFFFSPTCRFLASCTWYTDPASYVLMLGILIGGFCRNPGVTMAALTLGVLNRPESMSMIPVLGVLWWERDRPVRSLLPLLGCALPGVACYLAMQFVWPRISDYEVIFGALPDIMQFSSLDIRNIFSRHGVTVLFSPEIYRELLPYSWGLLAAGLVVSPMRLRLLALVHVILSILPMLVATDFFRLPFFAFPVFFLLAGIGFRALHETHCFLAYLLLVIGLVHLAVSPHAMAPGLVLATMVVGWWVWKKPFGFVPRAEG